MTYKITTKNYRNTKMKYCNYALIALLWGISLNAWSVDTLTKQKYHSLLTEDYNILNKKDLIYAFKGMPPRPFSLENSGAYQYWRCFPRENISITLEDMGYSSEDFGWKDTLADLEISGMVKPGVFHEYGMRSVWPVKDLQKLFNSWRRLMKGEKYVCLAGHFVNYSEPSDYGIKRKVYGWIFDRLKTKKGCVAYLNSNCD